MKHVNGYLLDIVNKQLVLANRLQEQAAINKKLVTLCKASDDLDRLASLPIVENNSLSMLESISNDLVKRIAEASETLNHSERLH